MLSHGINIHEKYTEDCDNNLLHYAVLAQNMRAINLLLQHGADINSKNKNGNTCLHLCSTVADINSDMIRLLIMAGADLKAKNSLGDNPIGILLIRLSEESKEHKLSYDDGSVITKNKCHYELYYE